MDISNNDTITEKQVPVVRLIGQVKWFNSKTGYGFITAREGELVGRDIFVHYSSIGNDESKYKYLVQGEYVEFELSKPTRGTHEYIAVSISGVRGGELMCDMRKQFQDKKGASYSPRVYKTPDESHFKRITKSHRE